ncbi:MAG: SBBP repeat-containing protein [Bryobacteraceae bacterium]|nr:SBBP repeat-containing protein [Bryobacteraceae bacterium]MDW8376615.1 SBBP repeat-containing protein [Bryobacterales bacterium]
MRKEVVEKVHRLPLYFEPESTKSAHDVAFVARGSGFSMMLEAGLARFAWVPSSKRPPLRAGTTPPPPQLEAEMIAMRLEGAVQDRQGEGLELQPGYSSYFLGADPSRWRVQVPHYARVRFADVYAGIDVVYYGNQRTLEYDFVVKPGGRPSEIRLAWEGVREVRLASNGDLVLTVAGGEFRQLRPRIYQIWNGRKIEIAGGYRLFEKGRVGFELARYDPSRPLVIDPILQYASYLGGNGIDEATTLALDNANNIYLAGRTVSTDFRRGVPSPAFQTTRATGSGVNANYDGFLLKLNPQATSIIFNTYIGGNNFDSVESLTIDSNQNLYFAGETLSGSDGSLGPGRFPVQGPGANLSNLGGQDGFTTKLNNTATVLNWSSYLGAQATDTLTGIAILAGQVYSVGMRGGDIFFCKWNSLEMGAPQITSYGGTGEDIAFDAAGSGSFLYLAGRTCSPNLARGSNTNFGGQCDAFWARVNASLQVTNFHYLGGESVEEARALAVLPSGEVYLTGEVQTRFLLPNSTTYGTGLSGDAFVARYDATQALTHFGYIGGSLRDFGDAIVVDGAGTAYVGGFTQSSDFPVGPFSPPKTNSGSFDVFLIRVAPRTNHSGWNLLFSSYFGAPGAEGVTSIQIGQNGQVYFAGTAALNANGTSVFPSSVSTDPLLNPPFGGGGVDTFLAQLASAQVNFRLRRTYGPPASGQRSPDNFRIFNTLTATNTSSVQAENCGFNTSANGLGGLPACPNCVAVPAFQTIQTVTTATAISAASCSNQPVKVGCETNDIQATVNDATLECPTINPAECAPVFQPPVLSVGQAGGDFDVLVNVNEACSWDIGVDQPFVQILSPVIGSLAQLPQGRQTVRLRVQPNNTALPRSARVVASSVQLGELRIDQSNAPFGGVSITLAPTSVTLSAGQSATFSATVTGTANTAVTYSINPALGTLQGNQYTAPPFILAPSTVLLTATSVADPSKSASATIQLVTGAPSAGLRFVPLAPCRVMETRPEYNFEGRTGPFGPPFLTAGSTRTLALPQSNVCNIPAIAKAYVLNVTLVPREGVDFVTVFPGGENRPEFFTVRSPDGQIVANSAIVKAGPGGTIQVYTSHNTDIILDISGYMTDSPGSNLVYYPLTPCRVVETRAEYRLPPGPFGPPTLQGRETRRFRFPATPYCQVPIGAAAYSVTITVVPPGPLQFLTAWPAGGPQPNISNINSPAGRVLANSVILPASADGSIDVFVFDRTDVILDINGYFAPDDGVNGLYYFPVTQCRVADTRRAPGPFGGPMFGDTSRRSYTIPSSSCTGVPSNARGYSVHVTAIPNGSPMPFITVWPSGQPQPNASVLNAFEGQTVTNSVIVPANPSGAIDVYTFRQTHVVLDLAGYFGR